VNTSRQRGAVTPLVAALLLGLCALVIGGFAIGLLSLAGQDAQRAADAAVLSAATSLRDPGMPFDASMQERAEAIARANSNHDLSFEWDVVQHSEEIHVKVSVTLHVELPAIVGGDRDITRSATAAIKQRRFSQAERRLPKLVMVLDYSGSMRSPFIDGGQSKIAALEASIHALLSTPLMVEYGAVFYASGILNRVAVEEANNEHIRDVMRDTNIPNIFQGEKTDTAEGLDVARQLLEGEENTGLYVLLVSDGAPTECNGGLICTDLNPFNGTSKPIEEAKAAARKLWDRDVTIFTLEIRDQNPDEGLARFMRDVAGTPEDRANPDFHLVAEGAEDLAEHFRGVVSHILCTVGPLDITDDQADELNVYLTTSLTSERAIERKNAPERLSEPGESFYFSPTDARLRLSEDACDAIIERGQQIVIRYGGEYLIE
jgi:Mg-chelatase subunit ChlD